MSPVPKVDMPATGAKVLSYSYSATSHDGAGLDENLAKLDLNTSFDLDVTFADNAITIEQHLVIYLRAQRMLTPADGNVVDRRFVDTYTLGVDAQGRLTTSLKSTATDHSVTPGVNGFLNFFTGNLNGVIENVAEWARKCAGTSFNDIPVNVVQDFVFPGGKTFLFKNARFSDYQDLIAQITYADPS